MASRLVRPLLRIAVPAPDDADSSMIASAGDGEIVLRRLRTSDGRVRRGRAASLPSARGSPGAACAHETCPAMLMITLIASARLREFGDQRVTVAVPPSNDLRFVTHL